MDERPTKRRGPITLLTGSRHLRRCSGIVAAILALDAFSFGPACWLLYRESETVRFGVPGTFQARSAPQCYWPIGWVAIYGPRPIGRAIQWYAELGNPGVFLPVSPDRTAQRNP